jgi:hypothetical protein
MAISPRKLAANQQNARRSTGPKTAVGKARAAQNAVTHGLLARRPLLPDEDPAEFDALAKALQQEWQPHGAHEQLVVDRLVHTVWRWHRVEQIEVEIFASLRAPINQQACEEARREPSTFSLILTNRAGLQPLEPLPAGVSLTDAGQHEAASPEAAPRRAGGESSVPTLGCAFIEGSNGVDVFLKLFRYETALERTYYRLVHELERAQRARRGEMVAPPVAIDVTMNGEDPRNS